MGFGESGDPILASGNGGRYVSITAQTATHGVICPTIMPAVAPTGGARMASPDLPIITKDFAFLWPSGTQATPILKERLFGLTNSEGNHGEDCKELYYYLDATPTHSYLKMLYKYPQREFPYAELVEANRSRRKEEPEYELLDTGIFD